MTSDYPWEKFDTKPLGKALAQGKFLRWEYNRVMMCKPIILSAMERIEEAGEISPFPPTILIPEAIYDFEFKIVVHACPSIFKSGRTVYPIIEIPAPSVLFMPKTWFLGLLAHDFLHYVAHTINLHKKLVELELEGDSESPVVEGVIPNKEELSLEERDRYFYSNPKMWLIDPQIIKALQKLESNVGSKTGQALGDEVMRWMNKRRLMKEFKRGEVTGYRGEIWLHKSIIKKADGLGLI